MNVPSTTSQREERDACDALPVRARIDSQKETLVPEAGQPGPTVLKGCAMMLGLLILSGIQLLLAISRGETYFLPLLLVPVIPVVALGALFALIDRSSSAANSNPIAERVARMAERTRNGELGPPVPGMGEEGWLTNEGCLLENGEYYPWSTLVEPEWAQPQDELLTVTVRSRVSAGYGRFFRYVPWVLLTVLVAGPVCALVLAVDRFGNGGLQMDFVTVVTFNLTLLAGLGYVVALVRKAMVNPIDLCRLRLSVLASNISREELEKLLNSARRKR